MLLATPASPGHTVEDDVIAGETGVEVQGDVLRVMTDVDGESAIEAGMQR